jgi:CRISPR-associated protein Cmr4
MYKKAYGIIETLAPLHVGATAGEETGNLNLIFRDQFTRTGIIPGSSIRGRFRSDMRQNQQQALKGDHNYWYGQAANDEDSEGETTEAIVKFEYASLVWLPVYCPNQPVVFVSCPALLHRYQRITGQSMHEFTPYTYFGNIPNQRLFFNLGFLTLSKEDKNLKNCFPQTNNSKPQYPLVVVDNNDMAMIHDMALYRQSRVSLEDDQKKAKKGAFFNVEALPEGSILVFPIAVRNRDRQEKIEWEDYLTDADLEQPREFYFGGLESIGFGRTKVTVKQVDNQEQHTMEE